MSMDFASDVLAWDQLHSGKKRQITKIGKISKSKASLAVVGAGGGGWRGMAAEPEDMTLMLPFHDTRFWYHALIGQMSSC